MNDALSKERNMHLMDLRNHGDSEHADSMSYGEMAADLLRYADQRQIEKLTLLGHNIGAKTAMHFALLYPDRVAALISLDTLPVSFDPEHPGIK